MEIIRQAADPKCSAHLENTVRTIDSILLRGDDAISKALKKHLKGLFGVAELEHDEDFVSLVQVSILTPEDFKLLTQYSYYLTVRT